MGYGELLDVTAYRVWARSVDICATVPILLCAFFPPGRSRSSKTPPMQRLWRAGIPPGFLRSNLARRGSAFPVSGFLCVPAEQSEGERVGGALAVVVARLRPLVVVVVARDVVIIRVWIFCNTGQPWTRIWGTRSRAEQFRYSKMHVQSLPGCSPRRRAPVRPRNPWLFSAKKGPRPHPAPSPCPPPF